MYKKNNKTAGILYYTVNVGPRIATKWSPTLNKRKEEAPLEKKERKGGKRAATCAGRPARAKLRK